MTPDDANTVRISRWYRLWYLPVLVAYSGIVLLAAWFHEPWYDEAQAWLIARDCDFFTMLREQLRYEGHPPLWYLILKVAIACGLPYGALNILSALIATAGVGLFLAKSPFPKWTAALMPFTFFFAYQYAVIARSYVLLPLLLFAVATLARDKWDRPIRWAVAVILLSSISLHTFLVGGGIILVHLFELLGRWRQLDKKLCRSQIAAISIYSLGALFLVLVLWPPKDGYAAIGLNGTFSYDRLTFDTGCALDSAFFEHPLLTVMVLLASLYWFARTAVLGLFLAVWLPVLAIFMTVRVAEQHHGILFFTWLFVVWCSVDSFMTMRKNQPIDKPLNYVWIAINCVLIGLFVRQGTWTGHSVALEIEQPYCGAKSLAAYIKANNLSNYSVGAVKDWVAAVLPYFSENFIGNFPNDSKKSFIDYHASRYPCDRAFNPYETLLVSCDVIIWPNVTSFSPNPNFPLLFFAPKTPPQWQFVGNFPGRVIFKDRFIYEHGYSIFVSKRVRDECGLAVIDSESLIPLKQISEIPDLSKKIQGQMERAIVSEAIEFGKIIAKIDANSALSQFNAAIDIAHEQTKLKDLCDEDVAKWNQLSSLAHTNIATSIAVNQSDEAMVQLREAQRLNPKNPTACVLLGDILSQLGKVDEAVAEYQSAIRIYQGTRRFDAGKEGVIAKLEATIETLSKSRGLPYTRTSTSQR